MPPVVNKDVRVAAGVNGTVVIMGAWCSRCRRDSSPNDRGECMFCGTVIVDEDTLPVRALLAQIREQETGLGEGLAAGVHVALPEEPHEPGLPSE